MRVDLSVFNNDPLEFIDPIDSSIIYTIPQISTEFFIELQLFGEKLTKAKKVEDSIKLLQEMVCKILSFDESKKITLEYVQERFKDVRLLRLIVEETSKYVTGQLNSPNSDSPISKPKTQKAK